ncbi:LEPR-XLL domain-containing protein [Novipirellula rosea]|uniref:LEPR-XLL domain-containing protein n=1 Tax=Novipirellula rosea TaxID=1031540 RepID=UPI003CD0A63E
MRRIQDRSSTTAKKRRKTRKSLLQQLEPRIVLDADPVNVFAHFHGSVTSENPVGLIPFDVNADNFLSGRGTQVLGFRVARVLHHPMPLSQR